MDAYEWVFLDRLQNLQAQLQVKPQIEGLVFLSLRNFLHERQRKSDPIGFRVFEAVRTALLRGVEAGWIEVVEGDARIRSDTWLSFAGRGSLPGEGGEDEVGFADIASRWASDLLPELVTTRGRGYTGLIDRLARRIRDLSTDRIDGFRATSLVDALKGAVRAQWATFIDTSLGEKGYESSDDDLLVVVRKTLDVDRVEAADTYERAVRCVASRIAGLQLDSREEDYLERVWQFVLVYAAEEISTSGDRLPSQRQLATTLKVPRDRMTRLFERLREALSFCLTAIRRPPNAATAELDVVKE